MMKLCAVLGCLCLVITATAAEPEVTPTLSVEVDLTDGSRLIGTPDIKTLKVETSFARIELPLDKVAIITTDSEHGTATLELQNNDRLQGTLEMESFDLKTIFGKAAINMKHVTVITVYSGETAGGMVLHYSFDRDRDGQILDQSGRGAHGEIVGDVQHVGAAAGQAVKIQNQNTYILSRAPGLSPAGWRQLTVSAWVNLSAYGTYGNIVDRANEGQSGAFALNVGGVYGGKPYNALFNVDLGGKERVAVLPDRFADLNRWYHCVGVYDGKTVKYYANGEEVGSTDVPAELRNKPIAEAGGIDTIIGKSGTHRDWLDTHINGMIDNVRIYNRALTSSQIKALYQSEKR